MQLMTFVTLMSAFVNAAVVTATFAAVARASATFVNFVANVSLAVSLSIAVCVSV